MVKTTVLSFPFVIPMRSITMRVSKATGQFRATSPVGLLLLSLRRPEQILIMPAQLMIFLSAGIHCAHRLSGN